jgi:3',5'-cyclic AMP phosphodiesterase CpdA
MNTAMRRAICLFILAAVMVTFTAGNAAAGPLPGWKPVKLRESIYRTAPTLIVNDDGETAVVSFKTRVPTMPATVHIGFLLPGEEISYPVFIKSFTEVLPSSVKWTQDHAITVNLKAMRKYLDRDAIKDTGVDFYYRIELWNPEKQSVAYHDVEERPNSEFFNSHEQGADFYECLLRIKEGPDAQWRPLPTVIEGPFVDMVTQDAAVFSWRTDVPTHGTLSVGDKTLEAGGKALCHEIKADGLEPGKRYDYCLTIDDGRDRYTLPSWQFTTAPPPGSSKPFSFVFMSDSRAGEGGGEEDFAGLNKPVMRRVFKDSCRRGAHFIFFAGDLIDGYCSEPADITLQYRQWKETVSPVAHYIPIYESIGNHEFVGNVYEVPRDGKSVIYFCDRPGADSMEATFAREFVNPRDSFPRPETLNGQTGPRYEGTVYSFDYGNCHFAVMNSNYWYTGVTMSFDRALTADALKNLGGNRDGYIMENQLKWLDQDLKKAAGRKMDHLFVLIHQPPFPNGGHADSAMYWGKKRKPGHDELIVGLNDPSMPQGDVLGMRARFLTLLSKHRVLAVLSGHEHNYSRLLMDSGCDPAVTAPSWQIISGGVGAPYYFYQEKHLPWSHNMKAFSPAPNYCLFSIEGGRVDLTVYTSTGEVIDTVKDLKRSLEGGKQ